MRPHIAIYVWRTVPTLCEMVDRRDVRVTTYRNGRPAPAGTCRDCDTQVWRAGAPVLPDVVVHIQAAHTDERQAFCGEPNARVIGHDRADADDLFYLESLDYTLFVLRCRLCEFFELDQAVQQEKQETERVAVHVAAGTCPDDPDTTDRPVPAHHPEVVGSGGRNRSARADGVTFSFTAYSRGRERDYTCYWPTDCREPAGWHGFRHVPRPYSHEDYHLCARHWRVAMGYSIE